MTPGPARTLEAGGLRWHLHPQVDPDPIRPLLQDPEAFLANPALFLKHERVVTVARVPALGRGQPDLVLRRLNYGKPLHQVRDVFRPTRALRALRQGWRLEAAGVPTPRALAAAELRRWRWPRIAYLVTEAVPGAVTLAQHVAAGRALPSRVLAALAGAVARLHEAGFSHRDLQWTNVLLDRQLRPWVIDLDGLRAAGPFGDRRPLADLARLAQDFSADPAILRWSGGRFLRRYCRDRGRDADFRPFARAILAQLRR